MLPCTCARAVIVFLGRTQELLSKDVAANFHAACTLAYASASLHTNFSDVIITAVCHGRTAPECMSAVVPMARDARWVRPSPDWRRSAREAGSARANRRKACKGQCVLAQATVSSFSQAEACQPRRPQRTNDVSKKICVMSSSAHNTKDMNS
jgi:hypothetical protein